MAHTLRNVSRLAHIPKQDKLLNGEPNCGIGSVKKAAKAAADAKAKAEKDATDSTQVVGNS